MRSHPQDVDIAWTLPTVLRYCYFQQIVKTKDSDAWGHVSERRVLNFRFSSYMSCASRNFGL